MDDVRQKTITSGQFLPIKTIVRYVRRSDNPIIESPFSREKRVVAEKPIMKGEKWLNGRLNDLVF
jgi:hypothetical protein